MKCERVDFFYVIYKKKNRKKEMMADIADAHVHTIQADKYR